MRKFRDQPLARKALTLGIAPALCAVTLAGVTSIVTTYYRARTNIRADLQGQAAIVAENVAAPLRFGDPDAASATLQALRSRTNVDDVCVFDADDRLFQSYSTGASRCGESRYESTLALVAPLVVEQPVTVGATRIGTVQIAGNLGAFYDWMRSQTLTIGVALVGAIVIGMLLTWRLQRTVSGPVLALARAADAVSSTRDYALRAERLSNDEVGGLVDSFNAMLDEIQHRTQALLAEISERKRAEELKDAFLAAVSHELRTPLNAIFGWLQLVRESPSTPELQERALDSLERNARSQARLVDDLLDVARITAGTFQLAKHVVDLRSVIADAMDVMTPSIASKGLHLTVDLPATPCRVRGDAERLLQLLQNLLSNAVKFTPKGGRIRVGLSARDADRTVTITVADSGIGIDPAFLPYVFDRFRQADHSMTRHHGGVGLGLAIARELAALHGGTISAASEGRGHGAVLSVCLPALPTSGAESWSATGTTSSNPAPSSLRHHRVLVVDDDLDGLDIASATLVRAGADVSRASSGCEAIALWEQSGFDVLVCDLAMPEMDGFQVLEEVLASDRRAGRTTRALALTAYASGDLRARVLAAGFLDHILKPYDGKALVAAVTAALGPESAAAHPTAASLVKS